MRRLFWIALGATAGVLVVRKVSQTAQAYTPEGVGRSLANIADALREAAGTVREGMAEREAELRVALGVDADDPDPQQPAEFLEHPVVPRHRG
jgi:hypothetical protein